MPDRRDDKTGTGIDRDLDALRADYARLKKHEPATTTDAEILEAARRAKRPRRTGAWTAAFAAAACVGLAVVLIPAVLMRTPEPPASPPADLFLVQPGSDRAAAETAPSRDDVMEIGAPAPMAAPDLEKERALAEAQARARAREELASEARQAARLAQEAAPAFTAPKAAADPERLAALRDELESADEAAWRTRLLALREQGEEPLAAALLADFRARFERPEDFSLDDLAAEEHAAGDNK